MEGSDTMNLNVKEIEKIAGEYFTRATPGMSLLIGEKGATIFEKGFGLADIEKNIPIEPDTSFIIASITKQFTTMAVMMLKEKGLLNYDDTLNMYFPDFPEYSRTVTLRNLMTHTSGIKEYFGEDFKLKPVSQGGELTQEDILNLIKSAGDLGFKPNTRFSYCNSGYVILGAVAEKVSGLPLAEFLSDNVFKPLHMKDTMVGVSPKQDFGKLAQGYRKDESGGYKKTPFDMITIGWADGNIVSTVQDLFKWHNALFTESLVRSETLQEAFTPHLLADGTPTEYGFGWKINTRCGIKEIWHTGGTLGYISRFSRFVDIDTAIIMLTNLENLAEGGRDEIFQRIAASVLGKEIYRECVPEEGADT